MKIRRTVYSLILGNRQTDRRKEGRGGHIESILCLIRKRLLMHEVSQTT